VGAPPVNQHAWQDRHGHAQVLKMASEQAPACPRGGRLAAGYDGACATLGWRRASRLCLTYRLVIQRPRAPHSIAFKSGTSPRTPRTERRHDAMSPSSTARPPGRPQCSHAGRCLARSSLKRRADKSSRKMASMRPSVADQIRCFCAGIASRDVALDVSWSDRDGKGEDI
jgi:hypothetical protein